MNTPICDFVKKYCESNFVRLHMPGHKGSMLLGIEHLDITEIKGADSLYEASGIIRESEKNASALFSCNTYYSTEGSSQCIRAMLHLATIDAVSKGKKPFILASRNAHRAFMTAVALLDYDLDWIFPQEDDSYLSCSITPSQLDQKLIRMKGKATAVYITSPDYLGNIADIKGLSEVCKRHSALLLVDNAHGAYLKFLSPSQHPVDLGADMCCDSAHKTLPALTGGAYLHISDKMNLRDDCVRSALSLFGSTSPSYLILQSLDMVNAQLDDGYAEKLSATCGHLDNLRNTLVAHGYTLCGDEKLKLTINTKAYGYIGTDFADILRRNRIECEFSDPDFAVMMISPCITPGTIETLGEVLLSIPRLSPIASSPMHFAKPRRVMSVREAMMSPSETIPTTEAVGRILGDAGIACPPAVPIVLSGEQITADNIKAMEYYGIDTCRVVR